MKSNLNLPVYPGFIYRADELSAFTLAIGIFTISLQNGKITHFEPDNPPAFEIWLNEHNIRDIRVNSGIPSEC